MLLRLVPITILAASLGVGLTPGVGSGGRGNAAQALAAEKRCALKPGQSPTTQGFRLGMTFDEAAARFGEFPQLARFTPGDKSLDLRDAAGQAAVSANSGAAGVTSLGVRGRYLSPPAPGGASPGEFVSLSLVFLDGRLAYIAVSNWRSPRWKEIYEFREWAAEQFGLAGAQWRVSRPPVRLPADVPPDFMSDTHALDCDGFTITASCVGPPGPPDLCDLYISDTEAAKTIAGRRRDAAGKEGSRP